MRIMAVAVLSFAACLLLILQSTAHGQPIGEAEISFSLPFQCETDRAHKGRCLAEGFKPGLSTVLLGNKGKCGARTAGTFIYQLPTYQDFHFEVTRLVGTERCFAVEGDEDSWTDFQMAVVGADPAAVRMVSHKEGRSTVPKEALLRARKLAATHLQEPPKGADPDRWRNGPSLSDKYKVLRTENVTLIIFWHQEVFELGPTVVLTKGELFSLEGTCTNDHTFFSVNDKLYLTYVASIYCCGCGDIHFFVYDLSGATPKKVYHNWNFSD